MKKWITIPPNFSLHSLLKPPKPQQARSPPVIILRALIRFRLNAENKTFSSTLIRTKIKLFCSCLALKKEKFLRLNIKALKNSIALHFVSLRLVNSVSDNCRRLSGRLNIKSYVYHFTVNCLFVCFSLFFWLKIDVNHQLSNRKAIASEAGAWMSSVKLFVWL